MKNPMTQTNNTRRAGRVGGAAQSGRGQSLVVAIIILFLLLFLGGIFITLIANNFKNTQRAVNVTAAGGFAEAGVRYLDEQLTKSPEGADWRIQPDNIDLDAAGNLLTGAALTGAQEDPDFYWLQSLKADPVNPTGDLIGGYTRIIYGGPTQTAGNVGGRALVRITYRPNINNPISKYIRLDAVGRSGIVDPADPTTFGNSERAGLRRELIAYKAIGITDYMRFVTNKDNKPGPVALGSPFLIFDRPISGVQGNPEARGIQSVYNGPIRVNGSVQFYGDNTFNLNPQRNDTLEIAGGISMTGVRSNASAANEFQPDVAPNPTGRVEVNSGSGNNIVYPSTSPSFTTLNGLVRDAPAGLETQGLQDNDVANRNLRNVARLRPPVIDGEIGSRGLTRYRALTRNSAPLPASEMADNPIPGTINADFASSIGYGTGLYIGNSTDLQTPTSNVGFAGGGYNLRTDWLTPGYSGAGANSSWKGDLQYVPPAVVIEFTPRYIKITGASSQRRNYLRQPNGQRFTQSTIIRYSSLPNDGTGRITGAPTATIAPNTPRIEAYPTGDYVIFCEGNVRVRGVVGGVDPETGRVFKRNITVVSNGTVYVDGNLLRDNITPNLSQFANFKGTSSIALLARDYVCVNTTQFLNPVETPTDSEEGGGTPRARRLEPSQFFSFAYAAGPESLVNNGYNSNAYPAYLQGGGSDFPSPVLLVRHSSDYSDANSTGGSGSAVTLTVNDIFQPIAPGNPPVAFVPSEAYLLEGYNLDIASFFPNTNGAFPGTPLSSVGLENRMVITHFASGGTTAAYRNTRATVVPTDVRIEAFMYAQEGSFFIIPGPWFNPNPNDTYEAYVADDPATPDIRPRYRRGEEGRNATRVVEPRYPFHGQPLDVRITFYGAIAENLPAEIGDQGAWMEKWGWVPRFYGSTGLPNALNFPNQGPRLRSVHGSATTNSGNTNPYFGTGEGIVYVFDPKGILPYRDTDGAPVRPNPFNGNDPLPIVPRLPVAPGLLYFGEVPAR